MASLWDTMHSDLTGILAGEFSQTVELTHPEGVSLTVPGIGADVHASLDPDSGEMTVGTRSVHVTVAIAPIVQTFGALPVVTAKRGSKPWTFRLGEETFRVTRVSPDRTAGLCTLEGAGT